MPFPPVEGNVDFVALEERVLERWRAARLFEESLRRREGSPEWVF
jgi:isoleucyl-tRNA synthetase